MPTNQTANYQLSQWAKSDQVKMEDFNADNAKIDAAIKAEADARAAEMAALTAQVVKRGNCRIECHSYVGTGLYGESNPTVLTFPRPPLFFIVMGVDSLLFGSRDFARVTVLYTVQTSGSHTLLQRSVTWNGNQASFFASPALVQMNQNVPSFPYLVFAFYPEDEA